MAARHGRTDKQLKQRVEKTTDKALGKIALVALVACVLISAYFKYEIPGEVYWILGAAIVPDAIKFLRGDKS